MARPKKTDPKPEKLIPTCIHLHQGTSDKLRTISFNEKKSKSELVRDMINKYGE